MDDYRAAAPLLAEAAVGLMAVYSREHPEARWAQGELDANATRLAQSGGDNAAASVAGRLRKRRRRD